MSRRSHDDGSGELMVGRRSVESVSRMPVLVTLVATLIVVSVVGLVLNGRGDGPGARRDAAAVTSQARASAGTSSATASASPSGSASASPSESPSVTPESSPSTSPVAQTSRAAPGTSTARKPITYTVRRGDTLTVIAAWFRVRGYGELYAWNRKVIGDDPDLILPGQRITVSSEGMTVSR